MCCIKHLLGMLLVSFWYSSIINNCIQKYVHTKLLRLHSLADAKVFVAHTGNTTLHRVVPCHHWCASCFKPSRISINTSAAGFLSAKLPFFQETAAVVAHIKDHEKWREGRMHEYLGKRPLPTFPQSSVE